MNHLNTFIIIINMFTLLLGGPSLDVRIYVYRRQILTYMNGPHAERVND